MEGRPKQEDQDRISSAEHCSVGKEEVECLMKVQKGEGSLGSFIPNDARSRLTPFRMDHDGRVGVCEGERVRTPSSTHVSGKGTGKYSQHLEVIQIVREPAAHRRWYERIDCSFSPPFVGNDRLLG